MKKSELIDKLGIELIEMYEVEYKHIDDNNGYLISEAKTDATLIIQFLEKHGMTCPMWEEDEELALTGISRERALELLNGPGPSPATKLQLLEDLLYVYEDDGILDEDS